MKHLNRVAAIMITLVIGTFVMPGGAYAQVTADPETNARHDRVVGLWEVEVAVENCATGVPIASFLALHKYDLGGTGQIVPSTNPAGISAHMMIWNHVSGNDYVMAAKFFRFNATGTAIGSTVLHFDISIDNDEYVGSGVAQFFDLAGNLVGANCPSVLGTRFTG